MPGDIVYVTWNIKDDMHEDGRSWTWHGTNSGSLTFRMPVDPTLPARANPFQMNVSYVQEDSGYILRILDGQKYSSGPDPYFKRKDEFYRWREGDRWYVGNPIKTISEGDLGDRWFTSDMYYTYSGEHIRSTHFPSPQGDNEASRQYPKILGDSTGTIFSVSDTWEVKVNPPSVHEIVSFNITVSFSCASGQAAALGSTGATAAPVCGCASFPADYVLDAGDPIIFPIISTLEVEEAVPSPHDIEPEGLDSVIYKVTCEGRRVRGAELEVSVAAKPETGSHGHDDASRPRGYLDGTRITAAKPSIKITTNELGYQTITFRPGTDLVDNTRGISGVYEIWARSTRFPYLPSANLKTDVKVAAVLPAFVNATGFINQDITSDHFALQQSTQYTSDMIAALATDFRVCQEHHNVDLQFVRKDAWPVVLPVLRAVSAEWGGLLDLDDDWAPPFEEHRDGTYVLIHPPLVSEQKDFQKWPAEAQKEAQTWLDGLMRRLGNRYGSWVADGNTAWNLHVGSTRSSRTFLPPQVTAGGGPDPCTGGLASGAERVAADAPDLSVAIFPPGWGEPFAAGVGQTVTYTLGIENLPRSTVAADASLTAILPAGLTLVRTVPPATRLAAANRPVWDLGALAATGIPRVFEVAGQIGTGIAPGTVLTVTAQATTSTPEVTLDNNRMVAFGLTVQPAGADLALVTDITSSPMTVNRPVTFTLGAVNAGNKAATEATVELTLPVAVTLKSALPPPSSSASGKVSWKLGTLAPSASKVITAVVTLDRSLAIGLSPDPDVEAPALTYDLTTGTSSPDFNSANNSRTMTVPVVAPGADLTVWLTAESSGESNTVAAGDEITYTVSYLNSGNQVASSTVLSLSLGTDVTSVVADPPATRRVTEPADPRFVAGVLGWDLGQIAVGQFGTVQVRARVKSASPEGNSTVATIQTETIDIHSVDNGAVDVRRMGSGVGVRLYLPLVIRR